MRMSFFSSSLARLALSALPLLVACGGAAEDAASTGEDELATDAKGPLVPETAPSRAIVLANADNFSGVNELHYRLLRGLFADRALADVKVIYLSPFDVKEVSTEARAKDGDRIRARFGTRFASEIASKRLERIDAPVDTNWARDYFPMALRTPDKHAVRFEYARMPEAGPAGERALRSLGYEVAKSELQLEGGNVLVDDDATLFTTTAVLKRNPGKTKAVIEAELKRVLGVREIEWLEPLPGEATGHVDIFAKIVGKKRAIVGSNDARCDAESPASCAARKPALDAAAKAFERRGYRVTRVMNAEGGGDFRTLTYANSLIVNGTAFLPTYFETRDADDLATLELANPRVPVRAIVKDCATRHPFAGTTEEAADATARERARCAIDGVVRASKEAGEPAEYLAYKLAIARRDDEAKNAYESLGFRVVQAPATAMINAGGSIHCVTMQLAK